ncbi:FibroRumin system radical SAM peptide maturase [Butyrivibrio sp. YAB3001]|uniref:FibroRumin system radical SAM peptide maturase n=1 Tax=Butyrivibrio sp. YAB3001 TaxID=1520812 RepID=UPI0008F634CF|nr:FibroRumin system radical SAM peptide maturase [Butyrivibrio sp. YAB3001]SFC69452.1 uncharacterized protein SAMN02910398_02891 [Butyrivibrio sp. YAB3001]
MVKLSRFAHTFEVDGAVALYHSLRMKPVYLSRESYQSLQAWLASSFSDDFEHAPNEIKDEVQLLKKWKILSDKADEDDRVLTFIRDHEPEPAISVCYMILSEQCNLACKYCFLGNNDDEKRKHFNLESMSEENASKAVDFFVKQLKKSGLDFEKEKPVVIFYGGEPLVNYSILVYIAEKLTKLQETEPCLQNLQMSMVTNGLLLNEERIKKLIDLKVGIGVSIDGFTEEENSMRIDRDGNTVFKKILEKVSLCQQLGANISLSVTLSEETVKHREHVIDLVKKYGIKGFGFNIMMSSDTFVLPESYNEAAADFIIDEFKELRELGIMEDRMLRKLDAFSKAKVYYSDCAATSGGQIVIAPNGQVGICHGCLYDKKYFVTTIDDDDFDCKANEDFIEWSKLSPVNKEECLDCPALGICGGGCPLNAMYSKEGNTIHSIDTRFCVHAKKTLNFLIEDLYRVMQERSKHSE